MKPLLMLVAPLLLVCAADYSAVFASMPGSTADISSSKYRVELAATTYTEKHNCDNSKFNCACPNGQGYFYVTYTTTSSGVILITQITFVTC